ncbi:hypothetical protein AALB39_24515 [Lachnospiraceae bacterium 54-53]
MDTKLNVGFVTTYSGRWPKEVPEQRNREYGNWLTENLPGVRIVKASVLGSSREMVEQVTREFKKQDVDVIVLVYGAFTGDDAASCLAEMVKVPLILWAPYEVPFEKDDRLYSNALCSMTMNAAAIRKLGAVYHTVYGSVEDERAAEKVRHLIQAYGTVKALRHTNLGLLGYRPTAFYNSSFDESLIRRTFGVKIEETDLKMVFDRMADQPEEKWKADMEAMASQYDTEQLPEGHLENHSRLYLALKEVMKEQKYDFATIKCWPEMGSLHTTPCAVLGRLADEGINIGCEGDVDAELAQMTEFYLTGKPSFITDLINIDEESNVITFWHCGNAAPSLCNRDYPVQVRNHPLAGQGTAFYGALKPGEVTIARFCNLDGKYKLFLMSGEALPMDRYTKGIMANVRVKRPVREVIEGIAAEGIPHHYSIVWENAAEAMKQVCGLLGIPVIEM